MDTTFDQARRCPTCKELGKLVQSNPIERGYTQHKIICLNDRCRLSDVPFFVETNNRNEVVQPRQTYRKAFPKIADQSARVREQIDMQIAAEMGGGAEIR